MNEWSMKESMEALLNGEWVPFTGEMHIQDFPAVRVREVMTRSEVIKRYGEDALKNIPK